MAIPFQSLISAQESPRELHARMAAALAEIEAQGFRKAVIVGHGWAGQFLLQGWLGIPLVPRIAFDLAPASVSEVRISSFGDPQLVRLNAVYYTT